MTELVRAAGGLVTRRGADGTPEVAVVHRAVYGDWTFPKGKTHVGESDEEAAVREVAEEASLACRLVRELETTRYLDASGRPKQVRYWLMEVESGELEASTEVDDARWLPLVEASALLTYERDLELVARLEELSATVQLVRHAKAKNRMTWAEPDELRPLTRAGRRQAEALSVLHEGLEISRLLSSPATRCVQTLEPLAEQTGLEIELAAELAEGSPAQHALDLLRATATDDLVACTHGDVLLDALVCLRAAGVPLAGALEARKGSTWVLELDAAGVRSARYVEAPDPDSAG